MLSIYYLFELLGFFALMLLLLAIAVIAKSPICHIIGSLLTLLSLLGLSENDINGVNYAVKWLVFLVILIAGFVWVEARKTKDNDNGVSFPNSNDNSEALQPNNNSACPDFSEQSESDTCVATDDSQQSQTNPTQHEPTNDSIAESILGVLVIICIGLLAYALVVLFL